MLANSQPRVHPTTAPIGTICHAIDHPRVHTPRQTAQRVRFLFAGLVAVGATLLLTNTAVATEPAARTIDDYALTDVFTLPAGAGPFDTLADGRLIVLIGDNVNVETSVGSRQFTNLGQLPAANISSFGADYIRVSPDGTRFAVGNGGGEPFGNFQVGIFTVTSLTGTWFSANSFEATWYDDTHVALTAGDFGFPSVVTVLNINSPNPLAPTNPIVVDGIDGASAGVAFDSAGNLYTGNGFSSTDPAAAGTIKAFDAAAVTIALNTFTTLDWTTDGVLIADVLSAVPLGFDGFGNMFVGGGDFFAPEGFAVLINASAVRGALLGGGAVDVNDPLQARNIDPDPAVGSRYTLRYNRATGELYVDDAIDSTVYAYTAANRLVPTTTEWSMLLTACLLASAGTIALVRRPMNSFGPQSARELTPS